MDRQQAQNIIKETFENPFDKERFVRFVKNLLNEIEDAPSSYKGNLIPDAYEQYISSLERIGKYTDGGHKIDILVVKLKKKTSIERARTMQRNFIAWYLNGSRGGEMKDAALAAFVSPNEEDWRFSLVKMDYRFEEGRDGRVKVKEEFTPACRWSFLVGKNEKSFTAQSRLVGILADDKHNPTLSELEEAFNIEKVTKEFFEKYRDLFLRTKETLDEIVSGNPNIKADFEAKGVNTVDFAKKLLGQIVFLYFLQKKGWFGVQRDADWGTGSKHFLRELFDGRHLPAKDLAQAYKNFFNDILEPLFYEALRIDRCHDDGYYSRFNCKIPFLNGGLFDPLNGYDWVKTDILLPNELFSNSIQTKEGDTGTGILDIFDRYNFTVKEDEPLEKEVAVDPEMLGKVFENLLEVKDRKSKGTYYTPREIVHYMCQQSLINYLYEALNDETVSSSAEAFLFSVIPACRESILKKDAGQAGMTEKTKKDEPGKVISREDIETLIKYGEQLGENEVTAILKAQLIADGKQQTTKIKPLLSESIRQNAKLIDDKLANIKVCDPAIGSGVFPVGMMSEIVKTRNVLSAYFPTLEKGGKGGFSHERAIYNFKRECIEKSLYGVDIDPGAVEIAKLRLWLSLVVDEDNIKNIKPLPNLDYKIVCGNSLLSVKRNLLNDYLFSDMENAKHLYFNETNLTKKQEYKNQIDDLISRITDGHKEFDFEVYFSEVFHSAPNSPFDKGGQGGFDIVIGNPPYIRQEELKPIKPLLQSQGYQVYNSTSDIYTYFYEKGWQVLNNTGHLTFITSNKWMRAKYGEKLRKFFKEKTALRQIIDFGGHKVFESATVDTNILVFQKNVGAGLAPAQKTCQINGQTQGQPQGLPLQILPIKSDFSNNIDLAGYFNQNAITMNQQDLDEKCFIFGDDAVMRLKKKIETVGVPLKDWDVRICFGIKTGFNEAFIIDNETKERLCKEDPKSIEVLKPILRGRDIQRYSYKWAGLWLIKIESGWTDKKILESSLHGNKERNSASCHSSLSGISLKEGKDAGQASMTKVAALKIFQDTYPAIYNHLKSKGETKGKGKGLYHRDDQGDYWWELRDCDYCEEFEKEKIVWQRVTKTAMFCLADKGIYIHDSMAFLTVKASETYFIAMLNSKVVNWYFESIAHQYGNTGFLCSNQYVEQLLIPKISESAQQPFITLVDQILAAKKTTPFNSPLTKGELKGVVIP